MKANIFGAGLLIASIAGGANAASTIGLAEDAPVDPATGISLPAGFKATVFADEIGQARHIFAAENGWVYVALRRPVDGNGAVALNDSDGDGVADNREYFAAGMQGTGVAVHDGHLYYSTDVAVMRWPLPAAGAPEGDATIIAEGFVPETQHASKNIDFDESGNLYVNVGAPSNACMREMRKKGSPGMRPCPLLEKYAGIWRFDAAKPNQDQMADGHRYSTGIRNGLAMAWNPHADALYMAQHGRDQFASFFPEMFTNEQSAELPSEEFHRLSDGYDAGWPYSYYDHEQGKRMVMPEYGGDGKTESNEGETPLVGFPGHWAPNDMLFLNGDAMPEAYQKGAFIAFHGSWNRAPLPQQGYRVVYVPLDADGNVSGDWVTFANGFAGPDPVMSPRNAKHRPMGLAEGPDGAIYISSLMSGGRVWKVTYEGN
ncbi:MAG: PQQ-dependent sugar dehydrogenase [Kordiimonadaceae bacterium]|nr:PQQ-dependent sugar dehydrogenase [Kordiimonadaceae bacterium]MBO6569670.1 PQQ-dependent sugar dehydrogenase [Kordiimonadaceae bacterium]MBO6966205.1 PQQ-dependent sugar dehydrogenase [Kordiimonadaceae bacterium]